MTLSDKKNWDGTKDFYKPEDVKQFIKELEKYAYDEKVTIEFIKGLAGDDLI